jgi:hypothetical protein
VGRIGMVRCTVLCVERREVTVDSDCSWQLHSTNRYHSSYFKTELWNVVVLN